MMEQIRSKAAMHKPLCLGRAGNMWDAIEWDKSETRVVALIQFAAIRSVHPEDPRRGNALLNTCTCKHANGMYVHDPYMHMHMYVYVVPIQLTNSCILGI